jgi:hypothetical protein
MFVRLQNTSLEPANSMLDSRLGILVEPSQVRLRTTLDKPYIWERLKEKEHLFEKNISNHSIVSLKKVSEGVGTSFAAVKKISTKELLAGCFQERVYAVHNQYELNQLVLK